MKFISWNVNGLRACVGKNFMEDFNLAFTDAIPGSNFPDGIHVEIPPQKYQPVFSGQTVQEDFQKSPQFPPVHLFLLPGIRDAVFHLLSQRHDLAEALPCQIPVQPVQRQIPANSRQKRIQASGALGSIIASL